MKALILDVGNTRTKLFAWDSDRHRPLPPGHAADLLDAGGQWSTPGSEGTGADLFPDLGQILDSRPEQPLVVTAVVPAILADLRKQCPHLIEVGHGSPLGFEVDVPHPEEVGSDRFCNLEAVRAMGLDSALVVDVGTATTIDLLQEGVFKGGLIAPGPETALEGLIHRTAQLPAIPLNPAPLEVGRDTRAAMAAGAWNTGLGGIRWCIEGLLRRYGRLEVILTGGLGAHLAGGLYHYDPHLTLRGAGLLAGGQARA